MARRRLVTSRQIDAARFVTHRFGLDEFLAAYDVFADAASTGALQANGTSVPTSTTAASGVYSGGSGEPPTSCVSAAIANAFFDATGVRLYRYPMSPGYVRAALSA